MASASLPRGNTLVVAEMIHRLVGGDQFQIVTETPYPSLYRDTTDRALKEQQKKARPQLKTHLKSLGDYDVIFLGYPNWWGTLPMAVMTFLEEYDFAGMTSLLPVLMAYSFTGNAFHAVLGALLFVFFVTHLALNLNWFLTVLAGRKSIEPWLRVAVNLDLIVIALMVVLGLSAVPISQTLLGFLHLPEIPEGRKIHVGLATWEFLLMAVHLGLHVTTLKARFGGGIRPLGPDSIVGLGSHRSRLWCRGQGAGGARNWPETPFLLQLLVLGSRRTADSVGRRLPRDSDPGGHGQPRARRASSPSNSTTKEIV